MTGNHEDKKKWTDLRYILEANLLVKQVCVGQGRLRREKEEIKIDSQGGKFY